MRSTSPHRAGCGRARHGSIRNVAPFLSALLLLAASRSPASDGPLFASPIFFNTGLRPTSVATADLNADGRLDVVVTNSNSNTVSVYPGRGDGGFEARLNYGTGPGPWSVAVGDLDRDGAPDLIVADNFGDTVSILLGNGDCTFRERVDYRTGGGPWCVRTGDLNGDGWLDLAVANANVATASVLLGNGDGTFRTRTDYPVGLIPTGVAIGDLNGDGRPDLAVSSYESGTVSILLGRGDGSFAPGVEYAADVMPLSIAIGDLDEDGRPDLAVGNYYLSTVSVLKGTGAGTFEERIAVCPTDRSPYSVAIADVNSDGHPDLVTANIVFGTASVILATGGGRFAPKTDYPAGAGAHNIAVGDVNGDLRPDLFVANSDDDSFCLLRNLGTAPVDGAPVLTGPFTVSGEEGAPVTFQVAVSEPDGDPIISLTAGPLPAGAAFVAGEGNASGTFDWTPDFTQAGTYPVTITAVSARRPEGVSDPVTPRTATLVVDLVIANADRPPVLIVPGPQAAQEGVRLTFSVQALDPDGEPVESLAAAPLPAGATFATDVTRGSGTLDWTPSRGQAGDYAITITASNARSASAVVPVRVEQAGNGPPAISAPAGVYTSEGAPVAFAVSAVDPDGDHIQLGVLGLPVGATFIDHGNGSASFVWTPGYGQSGTYSVLFTAQDDLGHAGVPAQVPIVVSHVNRAPSAEPRGPYAGIVNVPIAFDGTLSSDPDGDGLTYAWRFGDGGEGAGALVQHAYAAGGAYVVLLTVSDGLLAGSASTSATVQDLFPARAFTTPANGTIRLGSGKATWCAQVEPVDGAYLNTSVLASTVVMQYGALQISAQAGKPGIGADRDANGVPELTVCFGKDDLRTLFAGLPRGTVTVTVTLGGDLSTGGKFRAALTVDVASGGGNLATSVSPNPLNPGATLTFQTSMAGRVRVSVFDSRGRLVRTLMDESALRAGHHDVAIDGLGDGGARLASGVYFYRIESPEGTDTGRFAIMK